jgi:serine/threonine protein kinase
MIEAGTILQNRYRIEKHIGQGGMGKVYVATDERFNSTVAIKETVFEDINLRKAFEREARLLNSLKHPALPRVSDHFNENDGQFLVMEYIAGDDLAEMMERNGEAFPLEDVLKWANQLCDALNYLHLQDIIHRDIKPQNLKLTPGGQIVLLDFGLAKGNPTDAQNQTAAKSIFGYSRSYASLEQIQGTGTEPRSDLYSLSATLYHLLTGIPPADALTRAMNVLNGQPDPLIAANLINNKVSGGVAAILQKTMALNASERPESSVSMRLMLEDSDKYVDLTATNTVFTKPFAKDLLTQNTKILAPANISKPSQSQVKTKISPDNITNENVYKTHLNDTSNESKITNIRPNIRPRVENTNNASSRRKIGIATFGSLLLVGSAISAMYLYNSNVPQTNKSAETLNNETNRSFVIMAPLNEEIPKTETTNVNTDLAEVKANTKQLDRQVTSKSAGAVKNNVKGIKNQSVVNNASRKLKKSKEDSEEVVVNGETVEMGGMLIDENGIRMKHSPNKPPIPPDQFKGFNIKQLRQLEQLKNRKKRVIIVNPPEPKPTP